VFHFTKSFSTFATSYGMQEGSGLPDLHEGVVPVAIVDDRAEYVKPTYPCYTGRGDLAAVAAVYGLVGLEVPAGGNPIRILSAYGEATISMVWGLAVINRITANGGTFTPAGLVRGSTLTTIWRVGTTTVSPLTLDSNLLFYSTATAGLGMAGPALRGLVVRPGEFLWFSCVTVNQAATADIAWEELTFPTPLNPAAI